MLKFIDIQNSDEIIEMVRTYREENCLSPQGCLVLINPTMIPRSYPVQDDDYIDGSPVRWPSNLDTFPEGATLMFGVIEEVEYYDNNYKWEKN